jgi:hypothetical protein
MYPPIEPMYPKKRDWSAPWRVVSFVTMTVCTLYALSLWIVK